MDTYNDLNAHIDEYANTLRSYQARQDEMKSDARDEAAQSMKDHEAGAGIFADRKKKT